MGLLTHRAAGTIRRAARSTWRLLGRLSRLVEETVFKALSALVALAALAIIGKELLVLREPHAAEITAAGVITVVAALFSCFGVDLIRRLKKLGPLELFEGVSTFLSQLPTIAADTPRRMKNVEVSFRAQGAIEMASKLDRREEFHYRQADLLLSQIDFMDAIPKDGKHKRKYCKLLLDVAYCAFLQRDWVRAIERAYKLEEVAEDFKPEERLTMIGASYFWWGVSLSPGPEDLLERRDLFANAEDAFQRLIRRGVVTAFTYFGLGYIQFEFGKYELAVESNGRALRENPRFAAAKYNAAISYMKLGKMKKSYGALLTIVPSDDDAEEVLEHAKEDDELQQLLTESRDAYWVRNIRSLLNIAQPLSDSRARTAGPFD